MESSERSGTRWPPPPPPPLANHHHPQPDFLCPNNNKNKYHIHFSPKCPLHTLFLLQPHHPSCPHFLSPLTPPLMTQDEDEAVLEEEDEAVLEEEDEEESVFVLTDEWREFFAKSEAKRKAAKKQAKKKGKQ